MSATTSRRTQAYGFILGSAIAKGHINVIDLFDAKAAPGVLAIVTTLDMPKLPLGQDEHRVAVRRRRRSQHYHQAVAMVVAESFEQARAAASLIRVDYEREQGNFDLATAAGDAKPKAEKKGESAGRHASATSRRPSPPHR